MKSRIFPIKIRVSMEYPEPHWFEALIPTLFIQIPSRIPRKSQNTV